MGSLTLSSFFHLLLQPGVMRVKLTKSLDENYGFSLVQGEKGSASALYIRSVTPAGVAASDGHIHIGDRLLQVNRQSVIGMPHNKAVALIKKSSEHMTITLARYVPLQSEIPVFRVFSEFRFF